MKEKNIDSHIQIPKFILKQFENENHELFYYDFESSSLKLGHAKSLNTEKGYYSANVESFLNNYIETPFSILLNNTKKLLQNGAITMTSDMQEAAWLYFLSLISRGKAFMESYRKGSVFKGILSSQDMHDLCAVIGIQYMESTGFIRDSLVTLGVNKTKIPFVLPGCGFMEYKGAILMPITPVLVVFLVFDNRERFVIDGEPCCMFFDTVETVNNINQRLFYNEKANRRFVAASFRTQIESLLQTCS